MVILAFGLYRAHAVQSTWALCIAAGAIPLVGFGSAGLMVLSETDEAWEHTPEVEGFRALPGM